MRIKYTVAFLISLAILAVTAIILNHRTQETGRNNSIQSELKVLTATINGELFTLEVASTEQEQAMGLMFRESMEADKGMLFTYKDEDFRTFWMMNTYISLDIIFLDKDKKVVSISENTKTRQTDELYYSTAPAKYVIELNAGTSKALDLKPGQTIIF